MTAYCKLVQYTVRMAYTQRTPPEAIIQEFDFSILAIKSEVIPRVRLALINYYSVMTLRNYQETGEFINPVTICLELPRKVKELQASHPELFERPPSPSGVERLTADLLTPTASVRPPSVTIHKTEAKVPWTKVPEIVDEFHQFVLSEYEPSETPDTKFKDLLLRFSERTGHDVGKRWNDRHEVLCDKLGIAYQRVVTPGYQGLGTYHVLLRRRTPAAKGSPTRSAGQPSASVDP